MILNVLQICHSYYPPFLDCARQYAALFKGTNYRVTTVYLQGDFNQTVVDGSESTQVIFLGYQSHEIGGLKLGAIAKIKKIAAQTKFAFCIAHRVKPTYVALLATDLPVISVHHNYHDYSRWSRRLLVNYYKNRLLMLGVSNSVRDNLRRDLKNWSIDRIHTLYNRIDVEAVKVQLLGKAAARIALNLPLKAFVIGNVGRLHHDKDQKTLIASFAAALPTLPLDSLLVIIGAGPLESALKKQVNELKLKKNIIFTGNLTNAKQYFKAFDVFALTSDHEPFGMVLLEAMAAEIPIICSDCGGGAEIIQGVGDLYQFGDVKDLSLLLVKNASNKSANIQIATEKLFRYFSEDAVKKKFFELTFPKNV